MILYHKNRSKGCEYISFSSLIYLVILHTRSPPSLHLPFPVTLFLKHTFSTPPPLTFTTGSAAVTDHSAFAAGVLRLNLISQELSPTFPSPAELAVKTTAADSDIAGICPGNDSIFAFLSRSNTETEEQDSSTPNRRKRGKP